MDTESFVVVLVIMTVLPLLALFIKDNKALIALFWVGLPLEMMLLVVLLASKYFTAWYEYAVVFLITIVFSVAFILFFKFIENIPRFFIKRKLSKYSEIELKNAISTDNWTELPYILRELLRRNKNLECYRETVSRIASSDDEIVKNYAKQCINVFFTKK